MIVYLGRGVGGIQVKILDILDYLSEKGLPATLVVRKREGVFNRQMPEGTTLVDLDLGESWLTAPRVLIRLLRTVFLHHPKKIWAFADHTASLILLIKLLFCPKLKVYVSEEIYLSAYLADQPLRRIRKVFVSLLYRFAERIFVLSPKHQHNLVKGFRVPPRKIKVVDNWISPRTAIDQVNKARRKIDILFVGRLEAQKNLDKWLQVVSSVKKAGWPDIRAVLVGEGKQEANLKRKIGDLKLSKNVDLVGYHDNPVPFYRQAKIFLLTSRYEGQPLVLIEAMNYGVVPVITYYTGAETLIDDGITGYVVSTPAQAAKKISLLLGDQPLRNKFADKALIMVKKRFGIESLKRTLDQVTNLL